MQWLNAITALEISLIYGLVSVGIYLTFKIIDFPDLTCDGSFVTGAATTAIMVLNGFNPWVSLLGAIFSGSIAGLCTGLLVTRFKISDLLSGILVAYMLYPINLKIMNNMPEINILSFDSIFIFSDQWPMLLLIALIIIVVVGYFLRTDFGLGLRSVGQNPILSSHLGVNTSHMRVLALMIANSLIALAGGVFCQYQGFANISQGTGTVIVGFAAVIIGDKFFPWRNPIIKLIACFVGSMLYQLFISIALHSDYLGLKTQDLNLVTGVLVIVAMVSTRRSRC